MAGMSIVIGLGRGRAKPGKGDEHDQGDENEGEDGEDVTEYELGAASMRDRACALAAMHASGKRPTRSLDKMIEELPLDEREAMPEDESSDAGASHEPNEDTKY
jgi:hypothetical protein